MTETEKIAIIGQYVNGRNTIYNIRKAWRPFVCPSACASLESYAPAMGLGGHLPLGRELCCSSIYYLIMLSVFINWSGIFV